MVSDKDLLEALKRTREERLVPVCGICQNVIDHLRKMGCDPYLFDSRLRLLFWGWPLHSGCRSYPVPHREGPEAGYNKRKLWSKRTKYGRDRFALLDYAIAKLEAELEGAAS